MGQNLCQERPHESEFESQPPHTHQQDQPKLPKETRQQDSTPVVKTEEMLADEFAKRIETENFLLPAHIQARLAELNEFNYPEGPDVPKGELLKHPYLLQNEAIYAGEWKNGKMHGKGLFVLPDKSLLTCIVRDNVICRKARIIYPNGDYFEGDVDNNKANGKGKLVEGKTSYKGSFKDNLQHGMGLQIGEGYTFQGEFQMGQKKNGVLTWKKDNQTYIYKGQFVNNLFQGRGTLSTKEGRYIGQFAKGVKWGRGKFYYKNHRYYEGQFQNDKRHGEGKVIDENQSKIVARGRWQNDVFIQE